MVSGALDRLHSQKDPCVRYDPDQKLWIYLHRRRKESDFPPSGPEISKALGHPSYWAAGKLASLDKNGLVERLGTTSSGGNCYRITPAGRNALDKERG